MALIIIGESYTFPEGNAATNRVHTYAKGFLENGINVHVICFASRYNTPGDGIANGIHYYHPFGQRTRNKYFLVRRWQKITKYFKTIILITKINRSDKVFGIICYTQLLQTIFFVFFLAKYTNSKLILERSEHPLRKYQKTIFTKNIGNFKARIETKLCDGIFCISQYLIDFYKNRSVSSKKLILVPSTVDPERFNIQIKSPLAYKYILYCGTLTLTKDGVDILIKSFALIAEKYLDLMLVLIGKAETTNQKIIIKELISRLNLDNRVFLLGQLPRTEIAAYMNNAQILALARPTSIVADAGFPSKLTEYLATGVPVVVTRVGDIPVYLKDSENSFIAEPDNVDEFASKMDFVLGNYNHAKNIALVGMKLTGTIFNYNFQAKRIIQFIKSL